MERLNYDVLKKSGYDGYVLKDAPEKVLQFGEGNFLRAFVDYWFDLANEKAGWNGKCCLVQPIAPGLAKMINEQEGLYTLYLRGSENGKKVDDKRVISSVANCLNPYEKADYEKMMEVAASDDLEIIVSNTTEAGIQYDPSCQKDDCPPSSFPAKLTQVLYHRYQAGKPGIIMLACELIDNNGKELLKCVNQYIEQWGLEDGFKKYVNEDCTFCGSLVDRIVPGRIRDQEEVKALDEQMQRAFSNMKPAVTLEMIRRGENPLDMTMEQLNQAAQEIQQENGTQEQERFSKYLWKLEQNHEISEEERSSYIGIYRLIAQVEKGDGAALGFLMNQGSDVTMRNLLRAVRSEKKSGLDYQVDDDFDGVDSTAEGPKIDEQISAAFQQNCLRDVMEHISPEKLSRLGEEKWQNMSPEQLAEALRQMDESVGEQEAVSDPSLRLLFPSPRMPHWSLPDVLPPSVCVQ